MIVPKYSEFFDIDSEYFPVVNWQVIRQQPDLWKKFYPHPTFIGLIKNTVRVLNREAKQCLWVEGAYGTGKSHAVLTLKKLLEASEEEINSYFRSFEIDMDLCTQLQGVKSRGKILTVHRYGSSSIRSDYELAFSIQESIQDALTASGIESKSLKSLKQCVIDWITESSANNNYFNDLITEKYKDLFHGSTAEEIIQNLRNYSGEALESLMENIQKLAKEQQIKAMLLTVDGLCEWIKDVIRENNLNAVVFIWDEFTEYFHNNKYNLTGFQQICELSEAAPFCFILVTHAAQALFSEKDQTFKKINDRFVNPHCQITLPENIAFKLIGSALKKTDKKDLLSKWESYVADLEQRTDESRHKITQEIRSLNDVDLVGVLPIHPFAALALRNISASFDSNQRSMFDFIKNDRGDEIKGFQWFIHNCDPQNEPYLTVDLLWDFFYVKGRDNLPSDIRRILNYIRKVDDKGLDENEYRVLKTILLLQAISENTADGISLMEPYADNIKLAYEGTDLEDSAVNIARKLVRDKVLISLSVQHDREKFQANTLEDDIDLSKFENQVALLSTKNYIETELDNKTKVKDVLSLKDALDMRFSLRFACENNLERELINVLNVTSKNQNKIAAVACFAKDDDEKTAIEQKIKKALKDYAEDDIVFIEVCEILGDKQTAEYLKNEARGLAYKSKNAAIARQYEENAVSILKQWKQRIERGEFIVYSKQYFGGERAANIEDLQRTMKRINSGKFTLCLEEQFNPVSSTMYTPANVSKALLKLGVKCGCNEDTTGMYKSSSPATKLENALKDAWHVVEYWKKSPQLYISKIKNCIDAKITDELNKNGRCSIRELVELLMQPPYGFMPCSLTAFILGFLLKEYTAGTYSWTDTVTTETLTQDKLAEVIDRILKYEIDSNLRFQDIYFVLVSKEEREFYKLSADVFNISEERCTNLTTIIGEIRQKMKELTFPVRYIKYVIPSITLKTNEKTILEVINSYTKLVNADSYNNAQTENKIANDIGSASLNNENLREDLCRLFTVENCTAGMNAYLQTFDNGKLINVATKIHADENEYLNVLRTKFSAAENANWLWNDETVKNQIRDTILEYEIILETNKYTSSVTVSYQKAIEAWCEICDLIKIPEEYAEKYLPELADLLHCLLNIKTKAALDDKRAKEKFIKLLNEKGQNFKIFFDSQVNVFKQICQFALNGLSDEDVDSLFRNSFIDYRNLFQTRKAEYINIVDNEVKKFKDNTKSAKLKDFWRSKTNSDSPRDWSKKHCLPILCLVQGENEQEARSAFEVLNSSKPDASLIDRALEYLNHAAFFDMLDNQEYLEKVFIEKVISPYSVLLDDISRLKTYLIANIKDEPYDWMWSTEFKSKLEKYAEWEYEKKGIDRAWNLIQEMEPTELRDYLKRLIENNMKVGIEIINDRNH